ncbi:hypothetical protein ACFE04_023432 [Oxalis oulophora]
MPTPSSDNNMIISYNNNNNNRRNTVTTTTTTTKIQTQGAPPPEQEQLPCPRCESTNTKFCYYNNYNFSQPRHFCKSCRRYWTHGGTLRDIPVGGGTRKSVKRPRPTTTDVVPISSVSSSSTTTKGTVMLANGVSGQSQSFPIPSTPIYHLPLTHGGSMFNGEGKVGSFTSLLDTHTHGGGPGGFLALGGFGLGIGNGYEDHQLGFGNVNRAGSGSGGGGWQFPTVVADGGHGHANGGPTNTWQYENGESGYVVNGGGDCCSAAWPDLAISTPGNGLK